MPQTIPTLVPPQTVATTKKFNMQARIYTTSKLATVDPGTFAFMFTNTGNRIARVNNMIVYPGTVGSILGDSRSVASPNGDVYAGNIQITFEGAGNNPLLEVVTLYYVS